MRKLTWIIIAVSSPPLMASLVERLQYSLGDGDMLLPLLMALGAGFLTSLSPCVYPLIPITLTIMGARRYESHVQSFLVALSYVVGMSLVYGLLGAMFASVGMILGSVMQNPVVVLIIAGLFFAMGLSLFGAFSLVIPERVLRKLTAIGGEGKWGAFLMGMVAGVLAAPCTGPVLGFILTLIASGSSIVHGMALMAAFSFGVGLPFLVLGTFFSVIARIPKSGPWMNNVKNFFGSIIIGTAIYYVSLPWPSMKHVLMVARGTGVMWLMVFLIVGIFVMSIRQKQSRVVYVGKHVLGAVLSCFAVAAMLTFSDGDAAVPSLSPKGLVWQAIDAQSNESAFKKIVAQAAHEERPVLIDFYADWCVACKQLEHETFADTAVMTELARFTLIRVDASTTSSALSTIQRQFNVTGLPTVVIITKTGELSEQRILGFIKAEALVPILKKH